MLYDKYMTEHYEETFTKLHGEPNSATMQKGKRSLAELMKG